MMLKKKKILGKKASMSLQLVIIGIILLVVLAVVLLIFGTNIGKQDKIISTQIGGLGDCFNGEGDCKVIPDTSKETADTSKETADP